MLTSIGVKNLKSIKNKTSIDLKPITVLLGRNSSGKSSMIRLFPLLRQSFQEDTTGPILWYGKYADYGDYHEALTNEVDGNIELSFGLSLDLYYRKQSHLPDFPMLNFVVDLKLDSVDRKTVMREVSFSVGEIKVSILPTEQDNVVLKLKSKNISYEIPLSIYSSEDKFFPTVYFEGVDKKRKDINESWPSYYFLENSSRMYSRSIGYKSETELNQRVCEKAADVIRGYFSARSSKKNIIKGLLGIKSYAKDRLYYTLLDSFSEHSVFINNLENKREEILDAILPFILLKGYNEIAVMLNSNLAESFLSVKYLYPIRATTERYYRFQDLQVEEMDHTGSNVAMILNSFDESELRLFQKWTHENLGFIVYVQEVGSHYAIKIKTDNDDKEHNISDMGFGFSQVLPIVMSIWLETKDNSSPKGKTSIFVIEQPELHLHPAYQTQLAYLFANTIKLASKTNNNIQIIFETHSQAMIDAFGDYIESGEISKDDVNIVFFEKNGSEGTTVKTAEFDEEGYFINWPIGFFSGK
ncbi:AAA family ATPase [Citrobacter sp. Cb021]|uniref:AAA family ATPase n=1 Tax=Citrobacter sp. Cb021 TaxID=2985018 RepID=UPI002579C8D0|nr:AAA family ATPase [Citrobacter sp. Cb021]MDM3418877.1 AAA family ATPase [Citrobacter sp. Cb021]